MKLDKYDKILLISILLWTFVLSFNIIDSNPETDESTHSFVGLFIRDAIRDWLLNPTFSFNKIFKYSTTYLAFYPKISIHYPPLTQAFFALAYFVFGPSIVVSRFVVLFFSVCFIILIYYFAYRIYKSKVVSLIASLILLTSPIIVTYSVMAMLNILSLLLFTITIVLFFEVFQRKDNFKNYILPAIAMSLCLLTRWEAVVIVPVVFFYTLLAKRQKIKFVLFSFVVSFLLLSPYLIILYQTGLLLVPLQANVMSVGLIDQVWYSANSLSFYFRYFFIQFSLPVGILLFLGFLWYLKDREKEWKMFLIWALIVYAAMTLISNKAWQYTISMLPAIVIPSSYAIYKFLGRFKKIGFVVLACLLLVQFTHSLIIITYPVTPELTPHIERSFSDVRSISNDIMSYSGNALLNIHSDDSAPFIFEVAVSDNFRHQIYRPCLVTDYEKDFEQLFEDHKIEIVVNEKNQNLLSEKQVQLLNYMQSSGSFEIIKTYENYLVFRKTDFVYEKPADACNYICSVRKYVCSENKPPAEFLK